jgi:hypothetical protein
MSVLTLGLDPVAVDVILTTGGDFNDYADYEDNTGTIANWPGSSTLTLVFDNGVEWEASIVTSRATWAVDKDDADLIPNGMGVRLLYVNGTSDQILTIGKVQRR